MSYPRSFLGLVTAVAALTLACSGSEKAIIDRYFGALAMGDNQTLTGFAAVRLEEEVESHRIVSSSEESTADATLPGLAQAHKDLAAQLKKNKDAANKYALDQLDDVDDVRTLLQEEKPIPKRLEAVAAAWQEFNDEDARLRGAVSDAKHALESEMRICKLSVGSDADGLENYPGKVTTKKVELSLTIGGQAKPYQMTLRRYVLEADDSVRLNSRWVIYDLQPK
jgi:hypothetical protein